MKEIIVNGQPATHVEVSLDKFTYELAKKIGESILKNKESAKEKKPRRKGA